MRARALVVVAAVLLAACSSTPPSTAVPSVGLASTPTPAPTQVPRGPGGWLMQNDTMVAFLSLSGTEESLTGTLAGSYVPNDHVVEPFTATATASVANDGTLSITLDPQPDFAASGQASGKVSGSELELTYADPSARLVTLTFTKADAAEYNVASDALRQR